MCLMKAIVIITVHIEAKVYLVLYITLHQHL